eukprot:TRINITY_DN1930_c0_g3_i1.p1 TRINITY_DN1930_c0_g3~~TRINITY_DN1930_c0_g3_i1.p1  ORF type:complete len:194 (+),score=53.47 TRINITY_DN1930_c0_g3_i1:369-950(+)
MDQAQSEQDVNVRILGTRCMAKAADFALAGDLLEAESHANQWNEYVNNVGSKQTSAKASEELSTHNFRAKKVMTSVQSMQKKAGVLAFKSSAPQGSSLSRGPPQFAQAHAQPQPSKPGLIDRVLGFFSKDSRIEEEKTEESLESKNMRRRASPAEMKDKQPQKMEVEEEEEEDDDEANKNLIQARMNLSLIHI